MTRFSDWRSGYKRWYLCHMAFSPLWLAGGGGQSQTKSGRKFGFVVAYLIAFFVIMHYVFHMGLSEKPE